MKRVHPREQGCPGGDAERLRVALLQNETGAGQGIEARGQDVSAVVADVAETLTQINVGHV